MPRGRERRLAAQLAFERAVLSAAVGRLRDTRRRIMVGLASAAREATSAGHPVLPAAKPVLEDLAEALGLPAGETQRIFDELDRAEAASALEKGR